MDKQTNRQILTKESRKINMNSNRWTDRKINKSSNRWTDRQTDKYMLI